MPFFSFQQLTPEELEKKNTEFIEKIFDEDVADQLYLELREYFEAQGNDAIRRHWHSYWRWFTLLTWRRLRSLTHPELENTAVYTQLPMAILLDFDVLQDLLWYFALHCESDIEEVSDLYERLQRVFVGSWTVIGTSAGRDDVKVRDVVSEYIGLKTRSADSIQMAAFKKKIAGIFCPKDDAVLQSWVAISPEEAVERLLGAIAFFIFIGVEDIHALLEVFLRTGATTKVEEAVAQKTEVIATPGTAMAGAPMAGTGDARVQIDQKFSKTPDGQYADIAGVLAELAHLAEERGDPAIAELYYFDEKAGKFVWKV